MAYIIFIMADSHIFSRMNILNYVNIILKYMYVHIISANIQILRI